MLVGGWRNDLIYWMMDVGGVEGREGEGTRERMIYV